MASSACDIISGPHPTVGGGSVATRIEFGISITPSWQEQEEIPRLTQLADEAGLDLIGIQDHPVPVAVLRHMDVDLLPRRKDIADPVLP
jgi:alkanesulfonate monooxygenase SsuD/methylene tetrahydromethanopterin reductase-like flavin-dependent oxidoreductase (luciferase family)